MDTFFTGKSGQELLLRAEECARENSFDAAKTVLALSKRLKSTPPSSVALAVEIIVARAAAHPWGEWTKEGLFTRRGIQQSSQPSIAKFRAKRFKGCAQILEVGTGMGIDVSALALCADRVVTLEADQTTAAMARHNLTLQGINNVEVVNQTLEAFLAGSPGLSSFDGVWADPSRRTSSGERIYRVDDYQPPLHSLMSLPVRGVKGIKISPGINLKNLAPPWTREWLGVRDECLEQVLWDLPEMRDGGVVLANCEMAWSPRGSACQRRQWDGRQSLTGWRLVEPHAALIRAGALEEFFEEHSFSFVSPEIAYGLTQTAPPPSPWYRAFTILDVLPFNERELKSRLHKMKWNSRTEIKKRGFPETPDAIRKRLKLPPPGADFKEYGVVFLTRYAQGHLIFLAQRGENA